jgi:aminopeptidase N
MPAYRTLPLLAVAVILAMAPAATSAAQPTSAATAAAADIHSFARPAEARVTHVDLDLAADFAARRLAGTATLDVTARAGARELVLDTRGLRIDAVSDARGGKLAWRLGAADPNLGQPLIVTLPRGGLRRLTIRYATSPDASSLQWLTPEQTAGKKQPFLFSQGQAILTRTWIPTQDSPGIRQTYSARITVPAALRAVMSAEMLTPEGEPAANGRAFRFRLDKPAPPYLIALAVGDLAFKPLGPRTGVWTEPSMLDRSANELVDLETMVAAAERLYGPYRWGRYDLLVLPPSFPFGGMENPRLTFATPTIIAGDRSLVSLVAHELAHSWSGNLVTNATWADFWLNEGFTTYFENRIMEALYGPQRAAMLANLGWQDLQREVAALGGPTGANTRLHLDLKGRDPDEGMSEIAYEKGAALLRTIEAAVGRDRFDAWLRSYFDRHAFEPMTTTTFLVDIRANLLKGDRALEERIGLERWIYQPGVPSNAVVPQSSVFAAVEAQAKAFAGGSPAAKIDTDGWTTQHWQHFLRSLPREMPAARLADLEDALKLSSRGNSEILFAWLQLALRNRYEPAVPVAERFLLGMGRRKFVLPLFTTLTEQGAWGMAHARRIYAKARPGYHPVTYGSVDALLAKVQAGTAAPQ